MFTSFHSHSKTPINTILTFKLKIQKSIPLTEFERIAAAICHSVLGAPRPQLLVAHVVPVLVQMGSGRPARDPPCAEPARWIYVARIENVLGLLGQILVHVVQEFTFGVAAGDRWVRAVEVDFAEILAFQHSEAGLARLKRANCCTNALPDNGQTCTLFCPFLFCFHSALLFATGSLLVVVAAAASWGDLSTATGWPCSSSRITFLCDGSTATRYLMVDKETVWEYHSTQLTRLMMRGGKYLLGFYDTHSVHFLPMDNLMKPQPATNESKTNLQPVSWKSEMYGLIAIGFCWMNMGSVRLGGGCKRQWAKTAASHVRQPAPHPTPHQQHLRLQLARRSMLCQL